MPFEDIWVVAGGGRYKVDQNVERIDFDEDEEGPFMVLHLEVAGRAASIRVHLTRKVYEAIAN